MSSFRVGIIGCGRISQFHGMPAGAQETVDLVACCDIREERAVQRAELFGCDKVYTDYRKMIDEERLDVVHICLPHYLHAPVAMDAMNAGCNVLTEKPMAIALADAEAMVKCADRNGVELGVIMQNRYNAGSQLIKNALVRGNLGEVLGARAMVNWYRPDEYYAESDWKGTWEKEGGGVVIDQAIHTLDLLRWFIGEPVDYVDVHMANRVHKSIEVEDVADGIIGFESGVIASFWTTNYYSHDAEVEIEIDCEEGMVHMKSEEGRIVFHDGREFVARPNPEESFDYGGGPSYWGASHYKQIEQFYSALAAGKAPEITGHVAIETQRMVCAIYESGRNQRRVQL